MEFLVRMESLVPADMPPERLQELREEERAHAMRLREAGVLHRLWRVPGTRDAVGLWEAEDATVLHDVLAALPMFPWQRMVVEPLATHPQER